MEHSIDKNVIIIVHHSDHFTKVFSHDTAGGLFTSSQDALSRNHDNPQASLFSTLDQLESYRNAEGNFHFKICYPEVQTFHGLGHCNEWLQASNPTTEGTITGYERIHLAFPSNGAGRAWGGLGRSEDTETSLLDDTGSSPSGWMAVGATEYYQPSKETIPGPWSLPIDGIKKIELYVKPGPHLLPSCKYSDEDLRF